MEKASKKLLQSYFEAIEDPRVERTKQHKLMAIIIIAICGVLCGGEGWVEIEAFGNVKRDWLGTILDCPMGFLPMTHSDGSLHG